MKLILIFLATMLSLPIMAQSDPHRSLENIGDSRNPNSGLMPKAGGVKGTPLIFEEALKGDIIMANGKVYQGVFINIFPEKAQIFIRSDDEFDAKEVVVDNKKVEKIIFDKSERAFVPMKVEGKTQIVEIIHEGSQDKFIALHEKKYNKASVWGAYNSGPKYDIYEHIIRYFIINNVGLEEIKKGKEGLKTLGKEEWRSLQKYAKENRLDMDDPIDMQKIYLHSLGL